MKTSRMGDTTFVQTFVHDNGDQGWEFRSVGTLPNVSVRRERGTVRVNLSSTSCEGMNLPQLSGFTALMHDVEGLARLLEIDAVI